MSTIFSVKYYLLFEAVSQIKAVTTARVKYSSNTLLPLPEGDDHKCLRRNNNLLYLNTFIWQNRPARKTPEEVGLHEQGTRYHHLHPSFAGQPRKPRVLCLYPASPPALCPSSLLSS